jgi:NAD-dependent deacetylase
MSVSLDDYEKVAALIRDSSYVVALTGAGISTESGIPDYRGPDGLWKKYDPVKYVSRETLANDPKTFWSFNLPMWMEYRAAQPNVAHKFLAELETMGFLKAVITQNIDGLHKKAGSRTVYEVHGNLETVTCMRCHKKYPFEVAWEQFQNGEPVPTCSCGGKLRPDVVLFGDPMPEQFYKALEEAERCDLMLVMGSSLEVYPVAELPSVASKLVIVNLLPTPYDGKADFVFHERTGAFSEPVARALGMTLS